ncbi:MAG: metal ABC transporter solute-binding protein, Zn/Mn family [Nanobdellota archaeon]
MNYKLVAGIVLLTLIITACQPSIQEQETQQIKVLVSISPQKTFVEAVGGDMVEVKEIIPPGGSPATYEPKPGDLVAVENADIYFRIGHIPFEKSHMEKLTTLNPSMKVVDTSVTINLRTFEKNEEQPYENDHENKKENYEENEEEHDNTGVDPHIWLAPLEVKKQIDIIAQTLSAKDPKNKNIYQENAQAYKQELDTLHDEIEAELNELKTDKLMVFHPAWGYFADEYNLTQIAIEESGKEPTAKQLQHLIDKANKEEIKVIFVQSQFNKEIAQSIADEVGAVVVSIDSLSEDYINNLRTVAISISNNLT